MKNQINFVESNINEFSNLNETNDQTKFLSKHIPIENTLEISSVEKEETDKMEISSKLILMNLGSNFLNFFLPAYMCAVEVKFISHTEDIHLLTGVNLGVLFAFTFFANLFQGFIQSIAVLCTKSFGSKNFKLLGNQTNQVRIFTAILFIIYLILTFGFSESLLKLMGGSKTEYLENARKFIYFTIPGFLFELQYEIYVLYCESHLIYKPIAISLGVSIFCYPFLCYLLITKFALGVVGVAIAFNIINFLKLSCMMIYFLFFTPYPESHILCNKETFEWSSLKEILFLSLKTMGIFYTDFFGFSILLIFANKLSELSYSKFSIIFYISELIYSFRYAWSITNSTFVGYYIGSNSLSQIKIFIKKSFILMLILMIPILILVFIFRMEIFIFLCDIKKINSAKDVDSLLIIFSITQIFFLAHGFLTGVLNGCEMINYVTSLTILIFVILMPLLSYFLMFQYKLNIEGALIGLLISVFIFSIAATFLFYKIDFEKLVIHYQLITMRNNEEHNNTEEENN